MFNQNFCLVILLLSQINSIWSAVTKNGSLIQSRIRQPDGDADIKDAYFMVSIRDEPWSFKFWKHPKEVRCGGTLISNNLVLSAAHCFMRDYVFDGDADDYLVIMGNLDRTKKDKNTLKFGLKKLVVGKYSETREHDIALVFLKGKVPENHPTLKPVILSSDPIVPAETCQIYGWGRNENEISPETLKFANLMTMNIAICRQYSRYGFSLVEGMFCAGYAGFGPTGNNGDSGGPLICDGVQVGIASWVGTYDNYGVPAVFTEVSKYKTWILKQVDTYGGTAPTFREPSAPSTPSAPLTL